MNEDEKKSDIIVPPRQFRPSASEPEQNNKTWLLLAVVIMIVIAGGAIYYFGFYDQDNQSDSQANTALLVNRTQNNNQSVNTTTELANENINGSTNSAPSINYSPDNNTNAQSNANASFTSTLVDADQDKLDDRVEAWFGLSTSSSDTDGDGYGDYSEIDNCYNPKGAGRMTAEIYQAYCQNLFSYIADQGIDTQKLCAEWTAAAQKAIDNQGSADQIAFTEEFNRHCSNTLSLVNDTSNNSNFCLITLNAAAAICDPESLRQLIPQKQE